MLADKVGARSRARPAPTRNGPAHGRTKALLEQTLAHRTVSKGSRFWRFIGL
jgi:hypothetical protein